MKEAAAAAAAAEAASDFPAGLVYQANGEYFYDKTKSFYDKISCTSIEKMQQYSQPVAPQPPGQLRIYPISSISTGWVMTDGRTER